MPHAAYVGLQALLDAVPIALMEFRLSGERLVLLTANAAARRMPGLGGVREPGADARAVFDQLAGTALIDQLCGVARLGVPLDGRHVLRDGPRLQLAWDIAARRMASDCVLVAVSDVSEAEGLRQALQASEQALAEARRDLREQTEVFDTMETLARAGHWRRIKDPGETVLLWSPGLCEIAGFERQEWLDPEYAMSGILPEDRPLFDAASRAQDGANVEYRWRRPDGEVRWMRLRVQRVRSRDGVSVQMGVVQDVTEEHRAAEQLREQLVFIQRIASGQLVPGDALPPEDSLCREFGVSRITIRKAVEELLARHLIVRRRGVGTFVSDPRRATKDVTLVGVIDEVLPRNKVSVVDETW
ncbi:MAG: GntR family transcriptional regulator, partial [Comamonadaceae bacterium]|nr:GntR family transcriptional regulator [Comamonadaceae bacterium]